MTDTDKGRTFEEFMELFAQLDDEQKARILRMAQDMAEANDAAARPSTRSEAARHRAAGKKEAVYMNELKLNLLGGGIMTIRKTDAGSVMVEFFKPGENPDTDIGHGASV